MLAVASYRVRDGDLIPAKQSSGRCPGQPPASQRSPSTSGSEHGMPSWYPKAISGSPSWVSEQHGAQRRTPATQPGFPARRQLCPGSSQHPLSEAPLLRAGMMHLA